MQKFRLWKTSVSTQKSLIGGALIQIFELQRGANKAERRAIRQTISQHIQEHHDFLDCIFQWRQISSLQCLSGHVDLQNMHFWAQARPHEHQYNHLSVRENDCLGVGWVVMALSGQVILVRGCWWTSGNCEHKAIHRTNTKKIHPGTCLLAMSHFGHFSYSCIKTRRKCVH